MELMFWPLQGDPRLFAMPHAAFRNNSEKSSQRAMVIFTAEPRREKSRNTKGSLIFFESTKIKRTTLSTIVAEWCALMKCYGTCQMLRGLIKDVTGPSSETHMGTDANNLVTSASTTHVPEQQETIHMIQMLRKEACSGSIADFLADFFDHRITVMLFEVVFSTKLIHILLSDHYWNKKLTSGHGCPQFAVMLISDMMFSAGRFPEGFLTIF